MTAQMPSYTQLDEALIIKTIEELRLRIAQRFPEAGLGRVCEQFLGVAKEATATEAYLRRPNWLLRAAGAVAIVGLTALLVTIATLALRAPADMSVGDVVQTIEAGVNDIVFFGIAVFFLLSIETRVKRRRALTVLHELRSLAHIVDMHQLTKDPALLSAEGEMSPAELGRYLDFCSDILSLISKVAALLVQHFGDGVVLAAVNEIETLTTGLSRKVWQKITILERPSLSS
jgi:hypothetical protein